MGFEALFDASNGTAFKFESKGAVLEGYYMGSFDYEGDYGPTKKHVFKTGTGEALVVFGQRNLMQQLPLATVGAMLKITYTDDLPPRKKGQQPMKKFFIQQDKGNRTEVVGVDFTPTDNGGEAGNFTAVDDDADQSLDTDAPAADEVQAIRPQPPRQPARAPDAAQQAKVQALLNRNRAAKTA